MNEQEFLVEGMTCDGCARRVEAALNALPGIDATVSYATATAHVRADDEIEPGLLERTVTGAG